jgi:biotin carboxyl carrier protein
MFDTLEVIPDMVSIRERVVVAPHAGRFVPRPPEVFTTEGEWVEEGTVLAHIRTGSQELEVPASCRGWVMGMLAIEGQPVQAGEALFWLRSG